MSITNKIPSVSELIKEIVKNFNLDYWKDIKPLFRKGSCKSLQLFIRRGPAHKSRVKWEDAYTTPEEKLLLRFWFLRITGYDRPKIFKFPGVLKPGEDIWKFVKGQGEDAIVDSFYFAYLLGA
ncbi:MAG: hypothetical protein Ct9H300mP23_00570 [Nitrospinota bacterium]|nr:MAG: hypothetical protein Ct9H300mP23_00570 [Nitrospinota bacterium]